MSLIAMDMPETHADLVDWLERQLVGLDLAALVAELSAVQGDKGGGGADCSSVMNLLSGQIPEVIEHGLTVLDTEQVRALLRRPRCLLELQELVLTAGGAHWEKLLDEAAGAELQHLSDTGWKRMQLTIAPPMGADRANARPPATGVPLDDSVAEIEPATLRRDDAARDRAPSRFRTVCTAVLGTAALFLLGAFGLHQAGLMSFDLQQEQPIAQGWGWERPGAIPSEGPADAYLLKLAHAANDWFNKRPTEREDVAQRIREFNRGCQMLIESPHEPLDAENEQWLIEKCKAWRNTLDMHVSALEAGDDPLTVRAAADETIEKLIKAMRTRADEIG